MLITLAMYICIARVAVEQAKKGVVVCDENHCQYVPSRKGEFKAVKTLCAVTGNTTFITFLFHLCDVLRHCFLRQLSGTGLKGKQ